MGWLNEHYETFNADLSPATDEGPDWVCKRCGMRVGYVTKHAVVRHGDDIEVMPVKNDTHPETAAAY